VIVAFGDSITEGYGVGDGESYPAHLQRALDDASLGYRVINEGISGDTTSGGRVRVSTVTALGPEIVILELGGNDGLRGLPVDTTRANLGEIVLALKDSGADVVLVAMTLPPNYGPEYIGQFERVYAELAAEHDLPLVALPLDNIAGDPDILQEDRIHPTAKGHRLLAENVMRVIAPLLRGSAEVPSALSDNE